MKRFWIELDTRKLTVKQEDELIDALENVKCDRDYWSEFYGGEFTVMPVQLPECISGGDESKWVYGKIRIEGEVKREILENLYDVFEGVVPFADSDPFNLKAQRFFMDLIHFTVNNPEKGAALMERSREIAVGRC